METQKLNLKLESEKYTKSWTAYQEWYKANGIMLSARTLFDFFDIYRIFIEITNDYDFILKRSSGIWTYTITNNDHCIRVYGEQYNTRKIAEVHAFKKAFQVLNEKLITVEAIKNPSKPVKKKKRR